MRLQYSDTESIRSGERADWKRCQKRWYWAWRKGLVLRAAQFGALELGTWVHAAMAAWYGTGYQRADASLQELFSLEASENLAAATKMGAPEHVTEKGYELMSLGEAMMRAYQAKYRSDHALRILGVEVPLEFTFTNPANGTLIIHKFKPDAVFADRENDAWLLENKTAASIRTGHLVLDDQARPYGAMAERSLRKLGIIKPKQRFKGILYNFLRKALPDERPVNAEGKSLNKNGSVSKTQPAALFLRKPITLTAKQKILTLHRVNRESIAITELSQKLRSGEVHPSTLHKTPHRSCEKFCPFFNMCVVEEEGGNIDSMESTLYIRRDPYVYEEENPTADEHSGFEMV